MLTDLSGVCTIPKVGICATERSNGQASLLLFLLQNWRQKYQYKCFLYFSVSEEKQCLRAGGWVWECKYVASVTL